jgi:hypothetical protein
MSAATGLAIFLIPLLYVFVERTVGTEKKRDALKAAGAAAAPAEGEAH